MCLREHAVTAKTSCTAGLFSFLLMKSDGSTAGPIDSSAFPSSMDLKGLMKDTLRKLLQNEPSLFSQGLRTSLSGSLR